MRNRTFVLILSVCCFISSCSHNSSGLREKRKVEITNAQKEFAKMAEEKGIAEAFAFFADSNTTIKRQNDTLIHGKENIRNFYSAPYYKTATVHWSPDFVDAAESGDMGYTYGTYTWQSKDSTGAGNEFHGVFHTVWKRQHDGSWKFVWD